ncbi:MAG: hypothetical protein KatS3mg110_4444 [Pirellulaceae bacterium]|nr:MAG: hypothetical protein KatS3mg110_4444 [Pirellulaceae bacterium]
MRCPKGLLLGRSSVDAVPPWRGYLRAAWAACDTIMVEAVREGRDGSRGFCA